MKGQKKKQAGITLIALVISMIVMMILAGVSLNATVGENGIVTQAQNATMESRKASTLEQLNIDLANYNINALSGDDTDRLEQIVNEEIEKGVVEKYYETTATNNVGNVISYHYFQDYANNKSYMYPIDKWNNVYSISYNLGEGKYTAEFVNTYDNFTGATGNESMSGTTIISSNSIAETTAESGGSKTLEDGSSTTFLDEVSGEYNFYIPEGAKATLQILGNMELTNDGLDRSAIDIAPNAELTLWIADGVVLTVDSASATEGENATTVGAAPGLGGYAGIHVPSNERGQAILNLTGEGTCIAIGGRASNGGTGGGTTVYAGGGGGRWSRSWYRWQWWNRRVW